jgi:hypothetical protein
MDEQINQEPIRDRETPEAEDRRDAVKKLSRFAAYAAPFTLLALTKKADAATAHGPGKHS